MERGFPTKRSRSFLPMHRWVVGMSRRSHSSWSLRYGRVTVPASVYIIHSKTYLTQPQSPSPAKIFLTNTESLASLGSKGGSHFSTRTVL